MVKDSVNIDSNLEENTVPIHVVIIVAIGTLLLFIFTYNTINDVLFNETELPSGLVKSHNRL